MNIIIEKDILLLVEGRDEVEFFEALLNYVGVVNIVQIINIGGKDNFKNEFPALLLSPNFSDVRKYAIIRDADDNADNTFQSVIGILSRHNQPIPEAPGEIISSDGISTGVYIMPGNKEKGMLEDLCLNTVLDSPVLACVNQYISCLHENLENDAFPRNEAKAKMHAFLSGMCKFVPSLGIAAKKSYFNFESDSLDDIKQFLQNLTA